jgi:polyketide cyclase/dehydrase/lipid transport protein
MPNVRIEVEIGLPVPPEAAWLTLSEWERQADWMVDADRIEVLSRTRAGVGVRLAVRTRVLGFPAFTEPLEVVAWQPPNEIVMAHRGLVRGTGVWNLRAAGPGSRFSWSENLSLPVPLLGELALLVYRPFLRRLMQRSLSNLRVVVRARQGR